MSETTTLCAGARVTHRGRAHWGTGTVLSVAEHRGLDGRHWARVKFRANWVFHAEVENLEVAA